MSVNIYRHTFVATCPANGQAIIFNLEIRKPEMIRVEHITMACALHKTGYHEDIADELYARFGGLQVIRAHHHGVDIETVRGEA
jgi:hypothetical protein